MTSLIGAWLGSCLDVSVWVFSVQHLYSSSVTALVASWRKSQSSRPPLLDLYIDAAVFICF